MDSTRRARHVLVSAALDALDDEDLTALLEAASAGTVGVGGGSAVLDVEGVAVFAKRIPITDRELAHPHSTANLFDLPTFCHYGMHRLAGPGFGAWRELAANLSVTEGVLAGESEAFALLHHWRVLPGRPPAAPEHQDIEAVVAQFGGDPSVRTRFEELAGASSSLVLFLEYLPDRLRDWLNDPLGSAELIEQQLFDAVAFLGSRQLLHMDGHFGNMRADDDQIYLVDLGLATSPRFELSEAERDFVARHVDHDGDYAAMRLVNWLVTTVCGVPTPSSGGLLERDAYVRRHAGRRDPGRRAAGGGRHPQPARWGCRRDERLPLAPGRRRHPRSVSRVHRRAAANGDRGRPLSLLTAQKSSPGSVSSIPGAGMAQALMSE